MKRRAFVKCGALFVPTVLAGARQLWISDEAFLASSAVPSHLLNSLKSYYKFDSSGYDADSQGSNTLTQSGGTNNSVGGIINGYIGGSGDLHLSHAHNSDFDLGTSISFTLSVWFNPNASQNTYGPVAAQYDVSLAWILFLNGGNLKFNGYPTNTGLQQSITIGAQPSVAWHHVVVGYDSTAAQLFAHLDGGARQTKAIAADLNASTAPFSISYANVTGGDF